LYREVLQRAPDAPGLNGWVHALNSGVARDVIAEAFWESPEHRGLEVDQFYATFLHRAADGPGRAGWVTAILSGVSENEVAIDFLTSPEYTAAHADANSFVAGLYTGIFQRAGDAAGQAYWTSVVQSGLRSRAAVAYYFLTSTEAYLQAI